MGVCIYLFATFPYIMKSLATKHVKCKPKFSKVLV